MAERKFRLVTRSDMDGLVCAVLLKEVDLVDEITFAHPKDVQDGLVPITDGDITANLPYVPTAHLAFDHHHSEVLRNAVDADNHVIDADAPSAARVVYDHYGGQVRFPSRWMEMMAAVDKADSAAYTMQDVIDPRGWELLSFVMDARTGLGRFHHYRISNYQLMLDLIDYCGSHSIDEILALPDVRERISLYFKHEASFKAQLARRTTPHGRLAVLDLRTESVIWPGNRFMLYALYPECNMSMHVIWGKQNQNTVFAVGKSIFDRSAATDIGALMLSYGGGGHRNAGTCQVDNDKAPVVQQELIDYITAES